MKNFFRLSLLVAAIVFVASSCKKSVPDQAKYIPKDAMFVMDLDWKTLSDKASSGNINWDSLFRSYGGPENDSDIIVAKNKLNEFMKSGIDEESHVFFFVKTGGSIMSGQSTTVGVVMQMKDAGMFESYIKKQSGSSEIKKESNFSYAGITHDLVVGWNKDVAVLTGSEIGGTKPESPGDGGKQVLTGLFNLKSEDAVASIPEFVDLMKEKGDMLFWSNSSGALNTLPLLGMTKFADLLKDSYGAGIVNFENGKVTASFKSYSGKDLAEIWKKYAGPTTDMSMVTRYPYPVEGYAVFSFNPQIITEMVKYGGFESTVNDFLNKEGFTLDDITKAFKGDFAIVFSDITVAEKEMEYGGVKFKTKQPEAKLVFNAALGDKAAYDKIVKKLADDGLMVEKNGQYVPAGESFDMVWNMDGKNLLIATDSTTMQQYIAGKGNAAVPAAIADQSKGKSFAFYVDINKILQAMPVDSGSKAGLDAGKATFNNLMASAENFNGKYVNSSMQLNTVNASENSLVSLVKFFAAVAKQIQYEQQRLENRGMTDLDNEDSTIVAPPLAEPAEPAK